MPWKKVKGNTLNFPSRQDLFIIGGATILGISIITFFLITS